ncbi:MAG: helix-turn-helix transcriptional regulator [Microbispora sp.]|nr:helix-turn-helix transcriptional regulator [Microbispora sp.]
MESARQLLVRQGFHGLSLEDVARAAGVTRKTVYNHFGSKLGLLNAVFDAVAARGEVWRLAEAAEVSDPREAVVRLVGASCRLWASDRALLRRLVGLAAVDPETASVVVERERRREATWAHLVRRLEAAGLLRPGLAAEEAVRVLMALTSFATYDMLAPADADPAAVMALLLRLADGIVDLSGRG